MQVSHLCHNNSCCNAEHLQLLSAKENAATNVTRVAKPKSVTISDAQLAMLWRCAASVLSNDIEAARNAAIAAIELG
jgi:hypothetical protein